MTVTSNGTKMAIVGGLVVGLIAAVSVIVALGGDRDTASRSTTNETVTSTVSKEGAQKATVEDFARVVAEHKGEWDDQVDTTESNCLDPALIAACGIGYTTLGYQAETLRLNLSALRKPDAPDYVGVPPEEINDLLMDTENAADAVGLAAEDLTAAGCTDPMQAECIQQMLTLQSAIDDLSGKLDAWAVYS